MVAVRYSDVLGDFIMAVYEVVDSTSDEMYFPLGMYLTLQEAIAAIERAATDSDYPISEHADEYEKINVIERGFGWGIDGKTVYKFERTAQWSDDGDEVLWV